MTRFLASILLLGVALPWAARAEVELGNEVLAAAQFKVLQGKRIGLITNPSGVNRHLDATVDVLRAAPGVRLAALFGPEHGIYGDVPAGDKVDNRVDARTGLPVYSLYGKTHKPTPEMLQGLDALVYDLQDTGLPWVPTSPHVPHGESSLFLVATGILGELESVSTGIGYTLPFECVAAPGLDPHKLAEALNGYHLRGVEFRPITYKPYYFTFSNQVVSGVQIYLTESDRAPLTAINFYALEALKKVGDRDLFAEAVKAKRGFGMFDKVNGTDATRKALQAGTPAAEIVASWKAGEEAFQKARKKYLLY